MEEELIKKIIEYAKSAYSNFEIAHNVDHIERVVNVSVLLAKKEGADVDIVRCAAWLHDLGYQGMTTTEMVEKDHAGPSVIIAREFLESINVEKEVIEKICEAIDAHRTSRITEESSIEAKCVHDADKLDSSGVRGFMRIYAWDLTVQLRGLDLSELVRFVKDSTLKREKRLMTKSAREITQKFNKNVKHLVEMYDEEMNVK